MTRTRFGLVVIFAVTIAAIISLPAYAQLDTGSIVGTITDPSGAVLPGVTVTATQLETGVATTAVTTDRGQYVFPSLKIGRYSVAAELTGVCRAGVGGVGLHVPGPGQANPKPGEPQLSGGKKG